MAKPDAESKNFLEAATAIYQAELSRVLPYLESRGIGSDVARRFRLGSVSDAEPGHGVGLGRLAIPYLTPTGVVAIKFRCVADHDCHAHGHAKYMAPKGQAVKLYNVAAFAADSDHIGIAEGELDALVLSGSVGIPSVGVPGAGNWKNHRHWHRMFSGFGHVLVFGDPDTAGGELVSRICDSVPQARVVELPADVNDTFVDKGPDFIRQMAGLS